MQTTVNIRKHPFFEEMDDQMFKSIEQLVTMKDVKGGDYLKKEGAESKNFFIIVKGKIAFETDLYGEKTARLGLALEGDYFGESSLIPPYKTTTSRYAVEDSTLIQIDGVMLRQVCESNHQLGYYIMKKISHMLSRQLHRTREQLIHCHWG